MSDLVNIERNKILFLYYLKKKNGKSYAYINRKSWYNLDRVDSP